ncbi:MAG: CAAX prenyl protease-related protein, partial [Nitrospirales bacterium]|nr:CAAX prenyl protease-related protein [Nitrospirales bacterium]
LYMSFIGLEELIRFLMEKGLIHLAESSLLFLYPLKALSVFCAILFLWPRYRELKLLDFSNKQNLLLSISAGILVFVLWVNMDWPFAVFGSPKGYDPTVIENDAVKTGMIAFRLWGASVVVPIMEEIFWRSFLVRYVISQDFRSVPLGQFTWASFIITTILFGLEHNLWLAGIMAGMAYNLLLYRTKGISYCIAAHAVTNLCLGIYVLYTGNWSFW